jgi:hypothetical protein
MPGMSVDGARDEFSEFEDLEDWEFEATIQRAQQLLRSVADDPATRGGTVSSERRAAVPKPHMETTASSVAPLVSASRTSSPASAPSAPPPVPGKSLWPWLFLLLGIGAFACGAALVGMSLARGSTPLWQLGLPLVLGGQLAVLLVVIWQLDVVWFSHRATFVALHAVDDQLRKLQRQTDGRASSSLDAKIYSRHDAETVSPSVMLRVLRAQLDSLSAQIGDQSDAA